MDFLDKIENFFWKSVKWFFIILVIWFPIYCVVFNIKDHQRKKAKELEIEAKKRRHEQLMEESRRKWEAKSDSIRRSVKPVESLDKSQWGEAEPDYIEADEIDFMDFYGY